MFRVTRLALYVTLDDGDNYATFHELNVRIKINENNNSSQRELGPPVPHIREFKKPRPRRRGQHRLKNELIFYLRISRHPKAV